MVGRKIRYGCPVEVKGLLAAASWLFSQRHSGLKNHKYFPWVPVMKHFEAQVSLNEKYT